MIFMDNQMKKELPTQNQIYLEYFENEKLQTLSAQIGWSHNVAVFHKCKDELEREFYITNRLELLLEREIV